MANLEKGVLFNYEWVEACKELTPEEFSTLFFAIAEYQKHGTPLPDFKGTLKIISTLIFPCLKNRIESAELGKQGALKRWNNSPPNSPPNSISKDKISKDKINIISPLGEGKKNEKKKNNELLESQFAEFWCEYPKKTAKAYAKQVYLKIAPSRELHAKMLDAIKSQKNGKQWRDAQYIPNASTWLNREQWNDEIEPINAKYMQVGTQDENFLDLSKNI